uniref:Uncharacterized protein n=1 Tax=Spironucleus salmonicida TaxID=348837 RepID=V6LMN1_9EUKA|eukprot:EST45473.1 Hypothetical protein SS50377_14543 [Spironucleus salmonicida]
MMLTPRLRPCQHQLRSEVDSFPKLAQLPDIINTRFSTGLSILESFKQANSEQYGYRQQRKILKLVF